MLQGCPVLENDQKQAPHRQFNVLDGAQLCNISNFMQVAASGDLNRLETFLSVGLRVEMKADDESTILHCAARAGQAASVNYLFMKGARLDVRNDKRRLPIHEAILSNSPETLAWFLERITQKDLEVSKKELERYLARSGNPDIIDVYLKRLGSDFTDRYVLRKLSFAIRTGHYSLVTALLDDPDVNGNKAISGHWPGLAPIHLAAVLGRRKVMESLISCDRINVNLTDSLSRQPLHIAASKGHTAIVEQLTGHPNVEVNSKDQRGSTPLQCAASHGHLTVVAHLIRHPRIDIDRQTMDTATPLHYAVSNGHWETASLLLRYSVSMKDDHGISSEELPTSLSFTKEDLLHRLLKHPDFGGLNKTLPGRLEIILHGAVIKDDCEMIAFLLAYSDIDVNVASQYGETALMAAARNGKLEALRLLLQHKDIDVNRRKESYWKETALHYAIQLKHHEIVDLLLSYGAIDYVAIGCDCCSHKHVTLPPVPTTRHIENSQNSTLRPDHKESFDSLGNDVDDKSIDAWEEFVAMEKEWREEDSSHQALGGFEICDDARYW